MQPESNIPAIFSGKLRSDLEKKVTTSLLPEIAPFASIHWSKKAQQKRQEAPLAVEKIYDQLLEEYESLIQ